MRKDKITTFTVFCWNIQNPSIERAGKQALWIRKREEDILVLTEAKQSEGCVLLERYFQAFGYNVIFPKPAPKEYGVMVISKHPLILSNFSNLLGYLRPRVVSVKLAIPTFIELEIIGVYVPSRGFDEGDILLKKKLFIEDISNALEMSDSFAYRVFCGDLNILEPGHIPHYRHFKEWEYDFYRRLSTKYKFKDAFRHLYPAAQEYSWFGRSGEGYRYDHCFVSNGLLNSIQKCYYFHQPREAKLSDHSALIIELNLSNLQR